MDCMRQNGNFLLGNTVGMGHKEMNRTILKREKQKLVSFFLVLQAVSVQTAITLKEIHNVS